jgi:hypothetical protein
LGIASLALGVLTFVMATNKSDAEETRRLEQRLCRLEAVSGTGECKR